MNIFVSKSFFKMLIFIVTIISSNNLYCATSSGFNYKYQKSIFVFSDFYETGKYSKISELLLVDFKDKTKIVLDKGERISEAQIDEKSRRVLYKKGDLWRVINYDNREYIYKYKSKNAEFYLIKNGEMLSGVDYIKNKYIVIDVSKDKAINVDYKNEYVWGSDWDDLCGCVVFEVSKTFNSKHYLFGVFNGSKKFIEGKETINQSPFNKSSIVFRGGESDDSNTTLDIKLIGGGNQTYNISGPVKNSGIIWSESTLRILNSYALIDLKNGNLMYPTAYLWETTRLESPMILDMSVDKNGYVLKWDMGTKIFEVEDINTGKIIKTYKKFW